MHKPRIAVVLLLGATVVVLAQAGQGRARTAHTTELVKCSTTTPLLDSLGKAIDLTGVWTASDKRVYSLKQVGSCLWWSGPNVFFGQVTGSGVTGQWADVLSRASNTNGSLTLLMTSQNTLLRRSTSSTLPKYWKRTG